MTTTINLHCGVHIAAVGMRLNIAMSNFFTGLPDLAVNGCAAGARQQFYFLRPSA